MIILISLKKIVVAYFRDFGLKKSHFFPPDTFGMKFFPNEIMSILTKHLVLVNKNNQKKRKLLLTRKKNLTSFQLVSLENVKKMCCDIHSISYILVTHLFALPNTCIRSTVYFIQICYIKKRFSLWWWLFVSRFFPFHELAYHRLSLKKKWKTESKETHNNTNIALTVLFFYVRGFEVFILTFSLTNVRSKAFFY